MAWGEQSKTVTIERDIYNALLEVAGAARSVVNAGAGTEALTAAVGRLTQAQAPWHVLDPKKAT